MRTYENQHRKIFSHPLLLSLSLSYTHHTTHSFRFRYGEAPPENPVEPWSRWRRHARAALNHLRSKEVAKLPVRTICETQLLLRPYLGARQRMHLLYQVCRATSSQQLFLDFRKVQASDFTWSQGSTVDIKSRTYDGEETNALNEMLKIAKSASKSRRNNLLHKHALEGHEMCVKWLLKNGVSATHASNYNTTALHTAAFRGHLPVVKLLINFGARVNDATSDGSTALKNASSAGHADIVSVLLGAGANPDLTMKDGSTALYHAAMQGHVDICDMLCAANCNVNRAKAKGHTPLSMVRCDDEFSLPPSLFPSLTLSGQHLFIDFSFQHHRHARKVLQTS